jgi:hypothetical protein
MPKPIATTATGGDENDDGGVGNLRCLYDGERTKPIKTMKDKFELLPAFLKVRGLGAFFARLCDFAFAKSAGLVVDDAPEAAANSLCFFSSLLSCVCVCVCVVLSSFATHKRGGQKRGVKNNTDGEPLLLLRLYLLRIRTHSHFFSSPAHRIVRLFDRRGNQEDCRRQGEQQSHVRLGPELLFEV